MICRKTFIFASFVVCEVVRGRSELATITPSQFSSGKLRGKMRTSRSLNNVHVKEGFIDIKDFNDDSENVVIQFFQDELSHIFQKEIVRHVNDGFYWYGGEENGDGTLNILEKDGNMGKIYTG